MKNGKNRTMAGVVTMFALLMALVTLAILCDCSPISRKCGLFTNQGAITEFGINPDSTLWIVKTDPNLGFILHYHGEDIKIGMTLYYCNCGKHKYNWCVW